MDHRVRNILLVLANVLIPVAVLTFATGFFPYKPFLPGLAQYQQLEYGEPPEAPFDKVVFMVVDALRSDFVYSARSGFEFTQSLIRFGAALPFTAHATSPTITMPRVKAITTGSIPSFLDVILNFAESDTTSNLAHQDTWLAQLKAKENGKLVMYGDDTWLKLFPDTFERADGTSSFFVSDFTEVDNNVTRHVPDELRATDWNAMIMHYLGLDHIGHKAGPNSPNMLPKQREMDAIVKQIYEAITSEPHLKSTLFVLCGDHGMNDGGNHGGSAPGETSPALVFISPKLTSISKGYKSPTVPSQDFDYYTKVEQSDIAPTLAGLLGFPVPLNNLGVFISDLLPLWSNSDDRVQLLLRNAMQMMNIVKATFPNPAFDNPFSKLDCEGGLSSGDELACLWSRVTDVFRATGGLKPAPDRIMPALIAFCRRSQEIMSSTASNYNLNRLMLGIAIAATAVLLSPLSLYPYHSLRNADGLAFSLLTLLYGIMMFASSYVEEEQHFWYWATSAWLGYLLMRRTATANSTTSTIASRLLPPLALLSLHRLLQRWNQTGQKHAGAPDIVHGFLLPYPLVLWALVLATYVVYERRIATRFTHRLSGLAEMLGRFGSMMLVSAAFVFKASFTVRDAPELVRFVPAQVVRGLEGVDLVLAARVVFWGLGAGIAWLAVRERVLRRGKRGDLATGLHDLLTLFLMTQTRAQNIPLFLLFRMQLSLLAHFIYSPTLTLTPMQISITTLLLAQTAFFALGNSNAISSIDLSSAYNGVAGYDVLAVGLLVFVGNWAGPIWWAVGGVVMLLEREAKAGMEKKSKAKTMMDSKTQTEKENNSASTDFTDYSSTADDKARGDEVVGPLFTHIALQTIFTTCSLLAVMLACAALRTHLFIWTVFSPKYLYAMAWSVAFHLGVTVGVGGVVGLVG